MVKEPECNPDLEKERENCSFEKEEITQLFDGDEEKTIARRKLEKEFFNNPEIQELLRDGYNCHGHDELYTKAMKKAVQVLGKLQEKVQDIELIRHGVGSQGVGSAILPDGNPLTVHYVMFIPTIMGQASDEQLVEWLDKAWSLRMVGTYAQTELGHGTHVRGIETSAVFDPKSQEFILNSPTLTSIKWWPGGLAKTVNHCILMAQLYTKGVCHGVHAFLVQLRDLEDHTSLKGIELGDLGPKFGMKSVDNGFLRLTNVRIPRKNMLMKHSQVLSDGTYVKPPSSKLTYGTMVMVRVVLCIDACTYLKKAVTIATRYSAVRRQSEIQPGLPEPQVLDFQTQQYKIFPALASCFAIHIAANHLFDKYNRASERLQEGDLKDLPELHALSCAMKAVVTSDVTRFTESCRLACGGNGYLCSTNLPRIYSYATVMETYEGENTVLLLQGARYLVKQKQAQDIMKSVRPPWIYKKEAVKITIPGMIQSFGRVNRGLARDVVVALNKHQTAGKSPEEAWNLTGVQLTKYAEMNCRAFIVEQFWDAVQEAENMSPGTRELLENLCDLYCCYWILERGGDFMQYAALDQLFMKGLKERLGNLLTTIRQDAVSIVDSFDFRDEILGSTIGCFDGHVYKRLYEEALQSPLNRNDVSEAYKKYLGPFLKSKL